MLTIRKAKRCILTIVLFATFIAFMGHLSQSRVLLNQEDQQETEQVLSASPNDADGDKNSSSNGGIVVDVADAETTTAVTTNLDKPVMHTFFEPNGSCCGMTLEGHLKLVEAWEHAWQARGWDTIVLTKEDAMKYPEFESMNQRLKDMKVDKYNRRCFWRWMAMAMIENDHGGGGWMSDYDTFPLGMTAEEGLEISKQPGLKSFNRHVPNIIHASAEAWDRALHLMFQAIEEKKSDPKHNSFIVTDMVTLLAAHDKYGEEEMMITEWKNESAGYPYFSTKNKDDPLEINCEKANLAKVAHLSHHSTHLAYKEYHTYPRLQGLKNGHVTNRRGEAALVIMKDYRDKCLQEEEE
jgi:hypothetical protein